jgi:hypothetical protein
MPLWDSSFAVIQISSTNVGGTPILQLLVRFVGEDPIHIGGGEGELKWSPQQLQMSPTNTQSPECNGPSGLPGTPPICWGLFFIYNCFKGSAGIAESFIVASTGCYSTLIDNDVSLVNMATTCYSKTTKGYQKIHVSNSSTIDSLLNQYLTNYGQNV